MLLSEDEAKTKWCPHMKHPKTDLNPMPYCIGSACMAWRWARLINVYTPCDPETHNGANFTVSEELGGDCGRAGVPLQASLPHKSE